MCALTSTTLETVTPVEVVCNISNIITRGSCLVRSSYFWATGIANPAARFVLSDSRPDLLDSRRFICCNFDYKSSIESICFVHLFYLQYNCGLRNLSLLSTGLMRRQDVFSPTILSRGAFRVPLVPSLLVQRFQFHPYSSLHCRPCLLREAMMNF